jgi:hypothetical protein
MERLLKLFGKRFRARAQSQKKAAPRARLVLESLEERCTPSAVRSVLGFALATLAPNDDLSTGAVAIGFKDAHGNPEKINFFGQQYDQLYVNNNGNVTFDASLGEYTPFTITKAAAKIIAPFFADVDTSKAGQPVTYGTGTINGHQAFAANWLGVDYYNATADNHKSLLNTFQLLLINRDDTGAGNFDIEFNYDAINWETGDYSGGQDGVGGQSAHVGFSNGVDTSFELPGSGVPGAFLGSGLTGSADYSPEGVAGRYDFQSRNGKIQYFAVTPSTGHVAAGTPFTITVTAKDLTGHTVPNYTGTIHFACSDGQAVPIPDYTFSSSDQGSHQFQETLRTGGQQTITVTDTQGIAGIGNIQVDATTLTVTAPNNQAAVEGVAQGIALGSFSDPGSGPWTVVVNWSDGSGTTAFTTTTPGLLTQPHTFAAAGNLTVTVTVTNSAHQAASASFKVAVSGGVAPAPTVGNIGPVWGLTTGGTNVVITGTNLGTASTANVYFGSNRATILSDNGSEIVVSSPPGEAATVDVTVTTAGGTSALSSADQFIYAVPPHGIYQPTDTIFVFVDPLTGQRCIKFYDPPVAVGYDYQVTSGPDFAQVELPVGFTTTGYRLYLGNGQGGFQTSPYATLAGGVPFSLPAGVSEFRILGISSSAQLDPTNPAAFVTGLEFAAQSPVTFDMSPIVAPATSVSSSVNPALFGQAMTFTATVSGANASAVTPTGTVTFYEGSTVLGTATLSSGTATLTLSSLGVGSHSITVVYAGDTNFATSTSATLTQTVNQASSTAAVTASVNPSVFGQPVTFTAHISAVTPGVGTPTGTVTFRDGSTTLGTATLTNGTATFTTAALTVGSHSITVVYAGDTNFTTSTSATLTQTVNSVTPPAAPTGLSWTPTSGSDGTLSWSNVAGADGYDIYYWDPAKQEWVFLYRAGANVTSLSISDGSGYYFSVGAYNAVGENFSDPFLAY